jgi:hypothetical protein
LDLAEVDRALKRPRVYFLEDGLSEVVMGLWIGLTVALPLLVGGALANWSPVVMLLAGLGIRPAVLAAKGRWVYPRSGRVTYAEDLPQAPARVALGLSPATGPTVGPPARSRAVWWTTALLGPTAAVVLGVGVGLSRRLGFGDAGGHITVGFVGGIFLLVAAWRWRQRRWIALAVTFPLLGALVAWSGLDREAALALHAAGMAAAIAVSGIVAFVRFIRHAAEPLPETDGR